MSAPAIDTGHELSRAAVAADLDELFRHHPDRTAPGQLGAAFVPPTECVGVYCRISDDPRLLELGVKRQGVDGVGLCQARGWQVVDVYTDNDVKVLLPGAARPAYDRLMSDVASGKVTRIVAYGLARMFRSREERAEAIRFLSKHRVSITLVKGGELDLTSAAGRAVAGLLGEMDTMESEIKGERVARAALQRAEQGKPQGLVPYGWRREYQRGENGQVLQWWDVEDPDTAAVVRGIVDDLLAHRSLHEIARGLNERSVLTPRAHLAKVAGREVAPNQGWRATAVRKLVLRWANIAVVDRGGRAFGLGSWPAIVERDKHDRVVALLTAPHRRNNRDGARKHLLSYGIGECGVCGAELRVLPISRPTRPNVTPQVLYQCDTPRGHVARRKDRVDALVAKVVIARMARPDAADLMCRDDLSATEARERAATARAKLAQVQDDMDEDRIDRDQYLRSTARWRKVLVQAEEESMRAVKGVSREDVERLAGPQAAESWEAMSVAQRRAVLQAMGCTVVILKATKHGPGFDPTSVEVRFAADEEAAA